MAGAPRGTRGWLGSAVAVTALAAASPAAGINTVEAPIVDGIDIDGKLGDWPGDIPWNYITRGPDSRFKVAFDPRENLLYVLAEVEDETLTIGNHYGRTDALEIYTLALDRGTPRRGELPMQIAIVPGRGEYNPGCGNPCLYSRFGIRNVAGTRINAAYTYDHKTIRYEAVVEAFDSVADRRTMDLAPGREIGFDIVVVDADREGRHHWQPWGSPRIQKYSSPDNVGRCILSPRQSARHWDGLLSVIGTGGRVLAVLLATGLGVAAVVTGGDALRRKLGHPSSADQRLDAIEKRLTDTQDVLIVLSEKYDRMEALLRERAAGETEES